MTLRMPEYVVCNDGHGQQSRRGQNEWRNHRPHDCVKEHELDAGQSFGHGSAFGLSGFETAAQVRKRDHDMLAVGRPFAQALIPSAHVRYAGTFDIELEIAIERRAGAQVPPPTT